MSETESLEVLLADKQQGSIIDGGNGGWVVATIKDRQFGHGTARTVYAQHVLPTAGRTLEDANVTRLHNIQSGAGFAFAEHEFTCSVVAGNCVLDEKGQFILCESGKDRNLRESLGTIDLSFRHAVYCTKLR